MRAGGGLQAWLVMGNQGLRGRLRISPEELVCSFGALGPHRIARRSTSAVRLERLGRADLVAVERVGGRRESLAITVPHVAERSSEPFG